MAERYFTGVDFKQSGPPSGESIRLVDIPKNSNNKSSVHLESITLDELIGFSDDEVVEVEEGIWDPEDVKQEFINQLGLIDKQVGEPRLTMQGRDLQFVTPTEMLPKTEEEKNWLIETYGNDIVDGGSGDCTRKSDGTFVLRIGCVGQEEVMSKEDVLAVISHEYGHTLGNYIEDPIWEELKAYAFTNLFLRELYQLDEYRAFPLDASNIHDRALYWLNQLLDKGITEEEILSHLLGKNFDVSLPNDYFKNI